MVNPDAAKAHDTMVQVKSILLKFEKFDDIRANLPTNPDKPAPISLDDTDQTFTPDITAQGEKFTLFEVESAESIHEPQTAEIWTHFARYAQQNDAHFRIVVPKGCAEATQTRLHDLHIEARIDEVIDTN